ncbi:hypothetical protein AKJ49_00035 [candidate division MSBL1 archaeon SCGC-AAA382A03]|uniref:Trimethylamine methyltransferase n=1 Tax=candidate division MSBL1 archaeon SCGC-AAA382A03 TaxID=1698278 RepID=A0A133VH52_9EURY|nr:hypothetical protein AKJ49_00035 [candidate division MSBL1 archaeon SCGC-AAA382A03]
MFTEYGGEKKMGIASLNLLSEEDIEQIHQATVKVLEETGVRIHYDKALDIIENNGGIVDRDTKIVKFPEHVINEFLGKVPGYDDYELYNRSGEKWKRRNVSYVTFDQGTRYTDRDMTTRPSTKKDLEEIAIVADALDAIDHHVPAVTADDVPNETAYLHEFEATVLNTEKPLYGGPHDPEIADELIKMASVIAGGKEKLANKPFLEGGMCPVSPLQHSKPELQVLFKFAREGLPILVLSQAMAGGSAPITLPGTLVVHNAEVLSGIIIMQMVNPGVTTTYGSSTTTMDMRLGSCPVGAPETGLLSAAVFQLAKYYDLPAVVAGS